MQNIKKEKKRNMKKFCDKITKQQWRVSVPNLNSSLFGKTFSSTEEKTNTSLEEKAENFGNSGSYDFHPEPEIERSKSASHCVIIYANDDKVEDPVATDDSDQESRYEDASPMYEKKIDLSTTELNDDTDNLYADVENLQSTPKESNSENSSVSYEYDIPRISFSFFEDSNKPDYEVINEKPIIANPKRKSELKIVLAVPILTEEDEEIDDEETSDEKNENSDMSTESQDDVSISATRCEIDEPKMIEMRLSLDDISVSTLKKCDSEPSIDLRLQEVDISEDINDDDEEEGLYKVPRSHKRLSQSLNNINALIDEAKENLICQEPPEVCERQYIEHNVALEPAMSTISEDNPSNFDYCNARSKLPAKIRRATLLRRPHMRIKAVDTWSHIRSKVSNIIATHSAAQRVGANQNEKVINLEEFYKNSRSKCKKIVQHTGKIFSKKRGQENVDPNSCDDSSSQIVKNDAFFAKVNLREQEEISDVGVGSVVDSSDTSDKFGSRLFDDGRGNDFDLGTLKSAFRRSRFITEGQNGFEDLRRFVKQGGDFCKELSAILQERAEAELQYAKSLSKLSSKLTRACREGVGGLNEAWKNVATDMETRSEIHRQFSTSLCEDIVKPLRVLTDYQHKTRKHSEGCVDKTARSLAVWRTAEAKSKKQSHVCARDNEKLQDALLDVRLSKSTSLTHLAHMHNHKVISDKESAKLEGKKRKAEEAVKKADIEYYTLCVRSERARLEWESAVLRGSNTFQSLEEERLNNLKSVLNSYLHHSSEMYPKLNECVEKLRKPILDAEPSKDLSAFINLRNSSQHVSEQLLPDFYCEHITLAMNRERRKQALVKLLHLIRQDLERERKSKNGLESLSRAIKQTPNFGSEDSQQNVSEKLYHMRSMLTYLEGARYKVQSALAELESKQRTSHPLASHITITRDKTGLQQSILKVPQWLKEEFIIEHDSSLEKTSLEKTDVCENELPDWDDDRGMADGNSNQHDSDFDEFSSQGSSVAEECNNIPLGKCKALYAYTANLPDELNLSPGDVLSVYRKQEDGWWLGECNGCVGIFPATYVENI